jgi:mannitol-1-/sugar-/sorbitol-6-phosphatase
VFFDGENQQNKHMTVKSEQISAAAVLFDLDGVLVDSTACVERHWRAWSDKHKLDYEKVMACAHGRRTIETMRMVAPHLDLDKEADEYESRECLDFQDIRPLAGAQALLQDLPQANWAVVTSGCTILATGRLEHAGLPVPKILVAADNVANGKPDPEGYLRAAELLSIDPRLCLVFEDAPAGIRAAHAAGMRCLALCTTHSLAELQEADLRISDLTCVRLACADDGRLELYIQVRQKN